MSHPKHSARSIAFLILDAAASIERRLDHDLSIYKGVSLSEYQLLSALSGLHKATATRVDLARAVGLTPSGVTRALRPLEKIGYIVTEKDERDARRSLATLTPAGSRLVAQATKIVDEAISGIKAVQALPDEGSQKVTDFLEAVVRER